MDLSSIRFDSGNHIEMNGFNVSAFLHKPLYNPKQPFYFAAFVVIHEFQFL